MSGHVTPRSHPDLKWDTPKMFMVADELIRSDAFRSLSAIQRDIWLFALTERQFPGREKRKKGRRIYDYWNPLNGHDFRLSYYSIQKFFSKKGYPPPSGETIRKAIIKFMEVGLLSLVKQGGNGANDMSIYRMAHNWRVWKRGDLPCFVKAGMERGKGFCQPGSARKYEKIE